MCHIEVQPSPNLPHSPCRSQAHSSIAAANSRAPTARAGVQSGICCKCTGVATQATPTPWFVVVSAKRGAHHAKADNALSGCAAAWLSHSDAVPGPAVHKPARSGRGGEEPSASAVPVACLHLTVTRCRGCLSWHLCAPLLLSLSTYLLVSCEPLYLYRNKDHLLVAASVVECHCISCHCCRPRGTSAPA
jgi:hypothetical protein